MDSLKPDSLRQDSLRKDPLKQVQDRLDSVKQNFVRQDSLNWDFVRHFKTRKGQWPSDRADFSKPGEPGFESSSRQPRVVAHQHWARWFTEEYSLNGAVLCLASNHGIACALRLGLTKPVTIFWGWQMSSSWANHCGRAKRSRISDTHRLRWSLQFRYINNQSTFTFYESRLTDIQNYVTESGFVFMIIAGVIRT